MLKILNKAECCGCYGCSNICPKQCINMEVDAEGFYYPKVDENICVKCGMCENVCPFLNSIKKVHYDIETYACKNKDYKIRINSSSGGVFWLLCEETINKNGVVFGAAFDSEFNVKHTFAKTLKGCEKFRGSKYVQSSIEESYKRAKEFLDNGKYVLFSGTQCQIKGLNLFLNKNYDKLITADIICHGVPSPKVFNLYKKELSDKYNSNIKSINFRNKKDGWKNYSYSAEFFNKKLYANKFNNDIYMRGFLKNIYLRPSCYECKAKKFKSCSDLSLADYWGGNIIHPDFDDDKGMSLVLVNSAKGEEIFKRVKNNMECLKTDLDHAIKYNPCIVKSVEMNKRRKRFFKKLDDNNIEEAIEATLKVTLMEKIKNKIFYELSKL